MKLWDTHLHTDFSGDCDAAPESMIRGAKQLGLPGICFTDHLDWDHPDVPNRFVLDVDNYVPKCRQLAKERSSGNMSHSIMLNQLSWFSITTFT